MGKSAMIALVPCAPFQLLTYNLPLSCVVPLRIPLKNQSYNKCCISVEPTTFLDLIPRWTKAMSSI